MDETEEGDDFEATQGRDGGLVFVGGAGDGHEEIDGDGIDADAAQFQCHFGYLGVAFAYAEESAAAHAHADAFGVFDGLDAGVVGVAGANFGEMAAAGFQIVVEARNAVVKEQLQFILGENAQRGAMLRGFTREIAEGGGDFGDFGFGESASAGDDGKTVHSAADGGMGVFANAFVAH